MLDSRSSLHEWLSFLEQLHPKTVELGLGRITQVYQSLNVDLPAYNIVIAGTNGKGSCSAMLQHALLAAGKNVGTYTSPHILSFNERIVVDGIQATDQQIVDAFVQINSARGEISLTYFEFCTLAAMLIFGRVNLDIGIWEVGLGGRLDAVNIIDADLAIITSIDLDHQDWLGETREEIGFEKAGILCANKPAIYGDHSPPKSVLAHARDIGSQLFCLGKEYVYGLKGNIWNWHGVDLDGVAIQLDSLPVGRLYIANQATCLQALNIMRLLTPEIAKDMCKQVQLMGRMQILQQQPLCIADIAHNPQAIEAIVDRLQDLYPQAKFHLIISVLQDKNIQEMFSLLQPIAASWNLVDSSVLSRGQSAAQMREYLIEQDNVSEHLSFEDSYNTVLTKMQDQQKEYILVTGSFFIVEQALRAFK